MSRVALVALILLLAGGAGSPVGADTPSPEKADRAVKKRLEKQGARPGGILRVHRFPVPLLNGWTVAEDREEAKAKLPIPEAGWLYFVDYKAGPNYEHDVEFLFVSRRRLEVTSVKAAWWPIVRDAQGRTISVTGQPPAEEQAPWWRSQANRLLGDAGPSVQESQDAVKFDYMFAALPSGSSGMVMYSAPATLPKGGRIEVEGEDDPVWEGQEPAFVMVVDYHPKTSWPHDAKLVVWNRDSKVAHEVDIRHPPKLVDAEGKTIETDDGGRELGSWWADDRHSFLTRAGMFGR